MDIVEARRDAAQQNVRIPRSPRDLDGNLTPRAEALARSLTAQTVVPEDSAMVFGRAHDWFHCLKPQSVFQTWTLDQISVITLRIDRSQRIERRGRDRACLVAEKLWDSDRRSDVEVLGDRLGDDPAGVVRRLRRSPHGCDWLMERWAMLARIADLGRDWSPAQKKLAARMLGTPAEFLDESLLEPIDLDGRPTGPSAGLAALARREIAALRAHREEVAVLDEVDRALALSDHAEDDSPELGRHRRHENTLFRHLRWLMSQMQYDSPRRCASPWLEPLYGCELKTEALPPDAPAPTAPVAESVAVEPEVEVEPEPSTVPIRRREPRAAKAEARRQSKSRKLDRRRS